MNKTVEQAKVVLITGAARRIGAEIARFLQQHHFKIIIHYHRSKEQAEALAMELNQLVPNSARLLQADLMDANQWRTLVDKAADFWGRLDVLVNNAAQFIATPTEQATAAQWQTLMITNLQAPFFLAQAAIPYLQMTQGCIVNITDIYALRPLKQYPIYSISKAGLAMLTQSLAKDLAPEIRVNAVAPSATLWPEGDNQLTSDGQTKIIQRTALKRHGDPKQIAQAVLFCIQNTYLTGQMIAVDGGRLLD